MRKEYYLSVFKMLGDSHNDMDIKYIRYINYWLEKYKELYTCESNIPEWKMGNGG